jgi:L-asparaginase / beta-aspartyl-peptidase
MSTALLNEKRPLLARPEATSQNKPNKSQKFTLVIHGGAGTMARERSTPEQRAGYKAALAQALKAGYDVLERGGEAMDAAVAAVSSMEGTPVNNAFTVASI